MLTRILNRTISPFLGYYTGKDPMATIYEERWEAVQQGRKIYTHVHRPTADGIYPGVVFVPGALSCGTDYDSATEVTASEVASMGFTVLHYDPSGRGRSEGKEDFWGRRQQEELAELIGSFRKTPWVKNDSIGILSFSRGIIIAAGALAHHELPYVRYLFDWEGPSNRFNITKNDTHRPLRRFPTADLDFWQEREPVNFIGEISCGYFRYQAKCDHMQGRNVDHAVELVNQAAKGKAAWTQLNDTTLQRHLRDTGRKHYRLLPWWRNHKGQFLKYLLQVAGR